MKILLAVSDRDFLSSFSRLFSLAGYETDTSFDGTHVITKVSETMFDLVILEKNIPRVGSREIIHLLREKNIPVIMISDRRITSAMLLCKDPADAYISLPFLPQELLDLTGTVLKRKNSSRVISIGELKIEEKSFLMCEDQRITSGELDVLESLSDNMEIDAKQYDVYINSINLKLEKNNRRPRITYVNGEGYRWVDNYG